MGVIPNNEIVVLDIAGHHARVRTTDHALRKNLAELGFVDERDYSVLPLQDEKERIQVIEDLIKFGALFSYGRDWSPSELVEYYRQKGLIKAAYRVITWTSPEHYLISEK